MPKPERPAPKIEEYIPKTGNVVMVQGIIGRLVVIGVDKVHKSASVATPTAPVESYTVRWSELTYLDGSQNALRVVREATEGE